MAVRERGQLGSIRNELKIFQENFRKAPSCEFTAVARAPESYRRDSLPRFDGLDEERKKLCLLQFNSVAEAKTLLRLSKGDPRKIALSRFAAHIISFAVCLSDSAGSLNSCDGLCDGEADDLQNAGTQRPARLRMTRR